MTTSYDLASEVLTFNAMADGNAGEEVGLVLLRKGSAASNSPAGQHVLRRSFKWRTSAALGLCREQPHSRLRLDCVRLVHMTSPQSWITQLMDRRAQCDGSAFAAKECAPVQPLDSQVYWLDALPVQHVAHII